MESWRKREGPGESGRKRKKALSVEGISVEREKMGASKKQGVGVGGKEVRGEAGRTRRSVRE